MESTPIKRGAVHTRGRALQERDFTGLRFGNITPTDIDGLIEYHNERYVIIEAKFGNNNMDFGQELALTRLCDDLGKPSILVIAKHNTP